MSMLERWTPIRELDRMERRVRRLFEDAGVFPAGPASDIYETDDEYVVELEVPGFDQADLEVEVTDHTLVVRGTREERSEKAQRTMLLQERLEREFERRFVLPLVGDAERVVADFGRGVLTLHVPKTEAAKPRKITIGKK
jgi:HSP20 family protein